MENLEIRGRKLAFIIRNLRQQREEGEWRAAVDGMVAPAVKSLQVARSFLFMGDAYNTEYFLNQAEDNLRIIGAVK